MAKTYEAIVFLVDGFEEIEAIATLDILRRGGVEAASVSLMGRRAVKGSREITIMADMILDDLHDTTGTMLILPGGPGTKNYKTHELLHELLRMHNGDGGRIAAICAAPTVLDALGLLKNKTAVCYPTLDMYSPKPGKSNVVTDGNITTSKGPATTIEFALELVRLLKGMEKAAEVSTALLYMA